MRRAHRWLGLALALPLLLWSLTGLLFLVKPGWSGAYEMLDGFQPRPLPAAGLLPPEAAARAGGLEGVSRFELGMTALGPVYRLSSEGQSRLVDAGTGRLLSPLGEDEARRVALDAASRALAKARYGAVALVQASPEAVDVAFEGGAVVSVGRNDLALSQRGRDTDWIDRIYRVHYLQWTGSGTLDRPLELGALAALWLLLALGLRLAWKQ